MQGDAPVVLPGVDGHNLVPSVVALDPVPAEGGRPTVTVGNTARNPATPSCVGTFNSSTMMVMMTAITPSEKASRRAGLRLALLISLT